MTNNEIIAEWMGWKPGETCCYQPDRDILRWHGKDALLQKIEKSELRNDFMSALSKIIGAFGTTKDTSMWKVLRADPKDLAAALAYAIGANE